MTSPDAEESGTDFVKVTTHMFGATLRMALSTGLLATKVLCARATWLVKKFIANMVDKTEKTKRKMRRFINGTVAAKQQLVKRYH